MKEISVSHAFSAAPPRSRAALCILRGDGTTERLDTDWFTWLNMKHQPMLSFALSKTVAGNVKPGDGEVFALAFPPGGEDAEALTEVPGFRGRVPEETETVLLCTVSNSYNIPFGKVRIYNCNLEKAWGAEEEE